MDRCELKLKIPFGYQKVIAKEAGVSQNAVSLFLNGVTSSHKIELATLKVISSLEKEKQKAIK